MKFSSIASIRKYLVSLYKKILPQTEANLQGHVIKSEYRVISYQPQSKERGDDTSSFLSLTASTMSLKCLSSYVFVHPSQTCWACGWVHVSYSTQTFFFHFILCLDEPAPANDIWPWTSRKFFFSFTSPMLEGVLTSDEMVANCLLLKHHVQCKLKETVGDDMHRARPSSITYLLTISMKERKRLVITEQSLNRKV